MGKESTGYIVKEVDPQGNILNDNDVGVDYLGHTIYAEALAQRIHNASTPLTIGIFARWGSGKSFLVKHIQKMLTRYEEQDDAATRWLPRKTNRPHCNCFTRFLTLVVLFSAVVILAICAIRPTVFIQISNTTAPGVVEPNETKNASGRYVVIIPPAERPDFDTERWSLATKCQYLAIALLILIVTTTLVVVCCNGEWWSSKFFDNLRLLAYAAFTRMPIDDRETNAIPRDFARDHPVELRMHREDDEGDGDNEEGDDVSSDLRRKYIFVNFNAWEYAGSDTLWAGIVTNLSDKIEQEFGSIAPRLFRILNVETIARNTTRLSSAEQNTMLFVSAGSHTRTEELVAFAKDFGVVVFCDRYAEWSSQAKTSGKCRTGSGYLSDYWVIIFDKPKEAKSAYKRFHLAGIGVTFEDPAIRISDTGHKHQGRNYNDNHTPGARNTRNCVELQPRENGVNRPLMGESCSKTTSVRINQSHQQVSKRRFCQHFARHPKVTCKLPVLYWWLLLGISAVIIPVLTYIIASDSNLKVFPYPRTVPVMVQILAWLPSTAAASLVTMRFVWAMFHSQRRRVKSALAGVKGNMADQLGFMNKVKHEVKVITKLIRCVEFSHQKHYKIVISIDDLDRVPLDKIKSIMEAISILLSDQQSRFVCLIAVDSRIAVKCIEGEMGGALLKANINGHEYLKKIINLPFCLPQIDYDAKQQYIGGLLDQADTTIEHRITKQMSEERTASRESSSASSPSTESGSADGIEAIRTDSAESRNDVVDSLPEPPSAIVQSFPVYDARIVSNVTAVDRSYGIKETNLCVNRGQIVKKIHYAQIESTDLDTEMKSKEVTPCSLTGNRKRRITVRAKSNLHNVNDDFAILNDKEFVYHCRKFLYHDCVVCNHLEGNPRNIKRIFNVLSLTALTINCFEKQKTKANFLQQLSNTKMAGAQALSSDAPPAGLQDVRNERFAEDLVCWVVLTDQWPYRISFLIQVIEDADQRYRAGRLSENIADETSLLTIYETHVLRELCSFKSGQEEASSMSLDVDADIFYSFLKQLHDDKRLLKQRVKQLMRYTTNLDHSIRQSIAYQRDVADLERSPGGVAKGAASTTAIVETNAQPLVEHNTATNEFRHEVAILGGIVRCENAENNQVPNPAHNLTPSES